MAANDSIAYDHATTVIMWIMTRCTLVQDLVDYIHST